MYLSTQLTEDKKNVIVWERGPDGKRVAVYYDAPYEFFVENEDSDQEYYSVTGKKLEKIEFTNPFDFYGARKRLRESGIKMYESDVPPELKILSDNYYNQPIDAELNVTFYDIEVDYDPERGHSRPDDAYARISSIALYHKHLDESIVLALRPKKGKWSKAKMEDLPEDLFDHSKIELLDTEKELLIRFYEEIEDSDVASGWNCLPTTASVWKQNEIVKIRELSENDSLYDSTVKKVSPVSRKNVCAITLANGMKIVATPDHKFPTIECPKEQYTKFSQDHRSKHIRSDRTVTEISTKNGNSKFLEIELRENNNPDLEGLTEEDCYLAGLLYADGSLKEKNKNYGYSFYQSDLDFITEISESGHISGSREKGYSTYMKPRSKIFHSLIYEGFEKRLNLNLLSKLSKNQFYRFLSGFLDGDGWVQGNTPNLCCFDDDDLKTVQELLLWNGIFFTTHQQTIRLVYFDPNLLTLRKRSRWGKNQISPSAADRCNSQKAKLIKFKPILDSSRVAVRVKSVETLEEVDTMDIETSTHYFVSQGIITHNCEFFDRPYIYSRTMKVLGKKYTKLMNFPESNLDVRVDEQEKFNTMEMVVKPYGRIWIDFMAMVKKFDASERDSYSLEAVAEEALDGFEKLSYDKSLYRLYHEDFDEFLRYNIRDTDILKHLDRKFKYMNLALNFSHMVTNNIPAVLGTTSTSDTAILNFCKHEQDKRLVLPDAPYDVFDDGQKFEGAFVLDPQIGLHEWIASVDIKSLYPSSMRAINISPETIIGQFFENEKAFEYIQEKAEDIDLTLLHEDGTDETMSASKWREKLEERNWAVSGHGTIFDQAKDGIIPSILTKWFDERVEYQKLKADAYAKYEKTQDPQDKKDAEYYDNIQYLKKIQLNSLYGVFGNKYFRFFDVRIAESTTKTGKNVLLHMGKKIAKILDGEYKYPSKSVLYGDTDSIYFYSGLGEEDISVDEVSAISDAICEKVNKSYPPYMRQAFNCTGGREKYIIAEKEVVSDRGIFVKKKHYLLHLVELDGKPVDKMKVMGLQIKKTNIPKPIRIKLTQFFERFLKGEDWTVIKRDIVDYKQSLRDGDIFDIGVPSGVNNVEEGTHIFKTNPKEVYHMIRAAILYNECLDAYEDHESYPIRSGDKIKKFYFHTKKNFGPFNAIALPTDMAIRPDWLDDFMPYVDKNRQIKSLVDNPIKNILNAIGEAVPNSRNTLADELIEF